MLLNCLLHNSQHIIGQTDSISNIKEATKYLYIKNVNDHINFKIDVDSDFERFDLIGDDFEFDIRPNIALKSKISFSYKFICVNNDDDLKAKTTAIGFKI